jgi:hypothetical protein
MANDTKLTDMNSALTALNEKIDSETKKAQNDDRYVNETLRNIKQQASEYTDVIPVLNDYLTHKGKATFESPESFDMHIHRREQADALKNIIDGLAGTFNEQDNHYYFDNMPEDADTWLGRLFDDDDE